METSTKYGFYLPSRDTDDIADINQISDNFRKIDDEVQEKLESGKNLKTINNQSLLGSGNIEIQGGSGEADQKYSPTSTNAQSGIAVAEAVSGKMDKFGEVSELGGDQYISNYNGGYVFQTTKASSFIGAPLRVELADGTDPAQAANVEFVVNERRMKLIADHTVTAEEASEAEAWELSMSKINNGIPLDKVHIVYDIPNSTTITSNTTISARINDGVDLGSYLNYVPVNQNAYGSFWVDAEKIAENKWRNVRTQINSNITNSQLYANYFLGSVDVIDSIKIFGVAFEGINIKVWGRDAL